MSVDGAKRHDGEQTIPGVQESVLIDQVAHWLMKQALGKTDFESLLDGCCERLRAAGIPLTRAQVAFRTLHPVFEAVALTWRQEGGAEVSGFRHDESYQEFEQSPHFHMLQTGLKLLRRRLNGPEAQTDFLVLEELQKAGGSDYLAYIVAFDAEGRDGMLGSWTTNRGGGFSNGDIQSLVRIQTRLAVAYKVAIKEQIARTLLATYLGPEAGEQVLSGKIQRGDHQRIDAVIWYSDLRDSTQMAEALVTEDYLAVLNDYFDCTAGAVRERGGEVLLLLGDAVLAIFRTGDEVSAAEAAAAALAAAADARGRMAELNETRAGDGKAPLGFGIGLHVGEVMYGNIGVPERLQFTVTGAAVNEVARLEELTKTLARPVLVSRDFADLLARDWNRSAITNSAASASARKYWLRRSLTIAKSAQRARTAGLPDRQRSSR